MADVAASAGAAIASSSNNIKEEPMEEEEDGEKRTIFTYVLSDKRSVDIVVHFDEDQLSLSDPCKISTLSDLSLFVQQKDSNRGPRDISYDVKVTLGSANIASYELCERLYTCTRLRIGHLLPSDIGCVPVRYHLWDGEREDGDAVSTLTIHLTDIPRKKDTRVVCGTVDIGGKTIACSKEVLALHSCNNELFYPVFVPQHDETDLTALTLLLSKNKKVKYNDLSGYAVFANVCATYGLSRSIKQVINHIAEFVKCKKLEEMPFLFKLAKDCGIYAGVFMEPFLAEYYNIHCVQQMFIDNQKELSPNVTALMFETVTKLAKKSQLRPQIEFCFKEGVVRVEILNDARPDATKHFMAWLHDRNPSVLNRRRKSGVSFRTVVPCEATADPEDPDGRKLRVTNYEHGPYFLNNGMFYKKPFVLVLQHSVYHHHQFHDYIRFTRNVGQCHVLGVVISGEEFINTLTHLIKIKVTDSNRFTIKDPEPELE